MKTPPAGFTDLQVKHNYRPYKSVDCWIRTWNAGAGVFEYEVASTSLNTYLDKIGEINWGLDTEKMNVWRLSNISLTFKNTDNEFDQDVAGSLFNGKYLHKSKIEISAGYKNPTTGTAYTVYVFTGVIVKDPVFDKVRKTVTVNVSGLEYMTQEADAQKVANVVVGEALGTGAGGSAQAFTTDFNGVGIIDAIYVGGVKQTENVDFLVTNQNDPSAPANIAFTPAPSSGLAVTGDYRYWKANVTLKSLVESLLTEAGFAGADQVVDSALFYYGEKYKIWNTKTDLEDSVRSRNVDTTTDAGDAIHVKEDMAGVMTLDGLSVDVNGYLYQGFIQSRYECADLPESATPVWVNMGSNFATRDIVGGASYHRGESIATVTRQGTDRRATDTVSTVIARLKLEVSNLVGGGMTNDDTAYCQIDIANGHYTTSFKIRHYYHTFLNRKDVVLAGQAPVNVDVTAYHVYWCVIEDSGVTHLYCDNALIATGAGTPTATVGITMTAYAGEYNGGHGWDYNTSADYIYWSEDAIRPDGAGNLEGVATSSALNYWVDTNGASNYGTILRIQALGVGTALYETQTSGTVDFSADNDVWRAVSWAGDVGSFHANTVMKKYARWRVTLTQAVASVTDVVITEVTMPASILFTSLDCGTTLYDYGLYECWNTLNAQNIKSYSLTSADDSTFDAEQLIVAGAIASTQRRYIKFRNVMSKIVAGTASKIHRDKFTYLVQTFNAYMANFKDKTVQQAIEDIASLVDYEIGITTDGKYFFRSKTASAVVDYTFEESADIIQIKSLTKGWDRVANHITVEFGGYRETSDQFLALDAHPNSEETYGKRFVNFGGSNVLVDPNINVAIGMCQTYFANHKTLKNVIEFTAKTIFQIDLGDTIVINYTGITTKKWKVTGINLNLDDWTMAVTAWEI